MYPIILAYTLASVPTPDPAVVDISFARPAEIMKLDGRQVVLKAKVLATYKGLAGFTDEDEPLTLTGYTKVEVGEYARVQGTLHVLRAPQ